MDMTLESNSFKEMITNVSKVVIFLSDDCTKDMMAGALSLYLSLKKLQKEVNVIYTKDPTVDWANLVGINKVTKNLGNKNFVISLDYIEGSIERVSYNIEGNKFNLVIEPKENAPSFDEKKVHYNYSGFTADLIITVGVVSLSSLGKYYLDSQKLFSEKPIIAISNIVDFEKFGKINFAYKQATVSEIITNIIKQTEMPVDVDIATNLYDGIFVGSQGFGSHQVGADTFEAAAWCLRLGARKNNVPKFGEEKPNQEFATSPFPDRPQAPSDWLKPKIYKGGSLL
jgi:hypothetical protein